MVKRVMRDSTHSFAGAVQCSVVITGWKRREHKMFVCTYRNMYKYIHIIIAIKTNIPTYTHTPMQTKCLHNDDDPACAALSVIYLKINKTLHI